MPDSSVTIDSTNNVLGATGPNVNMTVSWTPTAVISKTGQGMILVAIPRWYEVGNKNSMMYDEGERD